jgi:hypothetical protein
MFTLTLAVAASKLQLAARALEAGSRSARSRRGVASRRVRSGSVGVMEGSLVGFGV